MRVLLPLFLSVCLSAGCGGGSDTSGAGAGAGAGGTVQSAHKLDLVAIDTMGKAIVDEPKTDAHMRISHNDVISHEGAVGIEIRGSISQIYPKKSYGLETRDAENEDVDVSLLGFPAEEDWILYAPYSDKSLMRNVLAYGLSRDMGRYASRTRFVEVAINGRYDGVYVFMEKLKRNDNRIDINKLNEDENSGEDLTGGYILKLDRLDEPAESDDTTRGFFASAYAPNHSTRDQKIRFLHEEPEADEITAEQKAFIESYVNRFEGALRNASNSPSTYTEFIDVDSFVDYFLLNELANNVDGFRLSVWLAKDKNEKLRMGPIWDFNLAFGNADYCGGGETDVWAYRFNERCPDHLQQVPFWWDRLLADPAFADRVKLRWAQLRGGVFAQESIMARIGEHTETLTKAGAVDDNFARWPVLGLSVWPNRFVGSSHAQEQDYLKDWIRERLAWLDGAIGGL